MYCETAFPTGERCAAGSGWGHQPHSSQCSFQWLLRAFYRKADASEMAPFLLVVGLLLNQTLVHSHITFHPLGCFRAKLGNEQDTDLSIIDPVQIHVELWWEFFFTRIVHGLMDAFNSEDFPSHLRGVTRQVWITHWGSPKHFPLLELLIYLPDSTTVPLLQQMQNTYDIVSALEDLCLTENGEKTFWLVWSWSSMKVYRKWSST